MIIYIDAASITSLPLEGLELPLLAYARYGEATILVLFDISGIHELLE